MIAALFARLEEAIGRDAAPPADVIAGVEQAMTAIDAARAPAARSRRLGQAEARVKKLAAAVVAKGDPKAWAALRDAVRAWRGALGLPEPKPPRRRFGLGDALADRPPPKSVCRKLEWEVGRPPMLVGAPGAGKTYAIQAAYLDLMLGQSLWGWPEARVPHPCRVLHVDLDQGAAKTLRRHRRLLRGLGVQLTADPPADDSPESRKVRSLAEGDARRQLGHLFGVDPHEIGTFHVDEGDGLALMSLQPEEIARWREAWIDAVRGFDVCFVDSLRRLAPFLDENDSRFSTVPDVLRVVSEAAQCVIVLLHHASNKVRQAPGARGAKEPAGTRGTSAIDGAAGSQLVIEEDGDARKVTQRRAGEAAKIPPFWLSFIDDAQPGAGGIRGLRVVHQTREEAKAGDKQAKAGDKQAKAETQRIFIERILAYVQKINRGTAKVSGYGPTRK